MAIARTAICLGAIIRDASKRALCKGDSGRCHSVENGVDACFYMVQYVLACLVLCRNICILQQQQGDDLLVVPPGRLVEGCIPFLHQKDSINRSQMG